MRSQKRASTGGKIEALSATCVAIAVATPSKRDLDPTVPFARGDSSRRQRMERFDIAPFESASVAWSMR